LVTDGLVNVEEIVEAVDAGKTVHWSSVNYVVENSAAGYMILSKTNNHRIGLTWMDGVTLNGKEEEFYIA
jgi:hypothetical protein